MNINDFRSNIDKFGLYHPSDFRVIISKGAPADARDLIYRCQGVNLPGRSIMTADHKTAGPVQKIGYESQFSELTTNIILSESLHEKDFFESWQDEVVGQYRTLEGPESTMFNIGYFDDYKASIEIEAYTRTNEVTNSWTFVEAYPTSVGEISLSWQSGGEIAYLPVTFAYTYYKKTNTDIEE